jgi:hypothetical protein
VTWLSDGEAIVFHDDGITSTRVPLGELRVLDENAVNFIATSVIHLYKPRRIRLGKEFEEAASRGEAEWPGGGSLIGPNWVDADETDPGDEDGA